MTIAIRHYLAVFLALMLVSQSAFAMFDFHDLDQSGTNSHKFDHSHRSTDNQNDNQFKTNTPENPANSLFDCHHCCYCHGSVFLTQTVSYLAVLHIVKRQPDYQTKPTSGIPPSLYRPPIA